MTNHRFYNALIGINLALPFVMSLILQQISGFVVREILFIACVFVIAVGNARLAKMMPKFSKWVWALSVGNLMAAVLFGSVALATLLPMLFRLAAG